MCWENRTLTETLIGSKESEATKEKVISLTPSPVDPDPHYSGSSSQWNTHYGKRNTRRPQVVQLKIKDEIQRLN